MRLCALPRVSAAVVVCLVLAISSVAAPVAAQEGASKPPAPPQAGETLPEIEIKSPAAAKPAPKAKAKKSAANKSATPATAAGTANTDDGSDSAKPETATGPVKDYSAKQSATGTKTDTPLKEIPQSISVVGAEQIKDMGARTIQETLQYVPGVVADAYGFDSRSDGSFIRGTDPGEFLDGLRRTSSYYSYNYRIDPFFLERLEVLRGPASVLYGQAPVGGLINGVTKRPQDEQGGDITVEYGTFDFKQVKFDTTGLVTSDGKWSYRLAGLARDADTQVDYVENDRYAIAPAITFRPDSATSITVLGHFQKDETGSSSQFLPVIGSLVPNVNGRTVPRENFVGEPSDHYNTDAASGTLIAEHKFNSVFKLSHVSRFADIHNDYDSTYSAWWYGFADADQETMYRTRWKAITDTQTFNQDTNLEAKFSTGILTHKVLGGVDYMNFRASQGTAAANDTNPFNVYDPVYGQGKWAGRDCNGNVYDGITTSLPSLEICSYADQKVAQTGLYVQDQMRLGNWIAVLGARKDWIENEADGADTQKDEAMSYRAGLMYEFASGFTPYASYGESFVPVIAAGGPFDPQKGRMYELGFKYQPTGANYAINSAVYDISESNRLEYYPGYAVQTGAVAIRGFEIELTGKVTENLKVAGGYSYTDAQYDGDENKGNQLESVPKHTASMWGVWEFDQPYLKGWSVGAGVRYIGESWDSTNTVEVPDVALVDAMVAYAEKNWRWSINAKNLEDKEYISTCLGRGDCWYGAARTVTTGLTYKY